MSSHSSEMNPAMANTIVINPPSKNISRLAHLARRKDKTNKMMCTSIGSKVILSPNWCQSLDSPQPRLYDPSSFYPPSTSTPRRLVARSAIPERPSTTHHPYDSHSMNSILPPSFTSSIARAQQTQAKLQSHVKSPEMTRNELMNILQEGPKHPPEMSIFHRRPSTSNQSSDSGRPSSRNSCASLHRVSVSTPVTDLHLGSDPLRSAIPLTPKASSSTLDSSFASSPLSTAYPNSFASYLVSSPEACSQSRTLRGPSATRSSFPHLDFSPLQNNRHSSFVHRNPTFTHFSQSELDALRPRRPSAPHLSPPGHAQQLSPDMTEFGSSLENYRFGTAQAISSSTDHRPFHDALLPHSHRLGAFRRNIQPPSPNPVSRALDKSPSKSASASHPQPKPPSQAGSSRSDRERDAPHFVRALSSDMSLYAHSLSSTSDSTHTNSYNRHRGSYASSVRCPLLDPRRDSADYGSILPMRPLPTKYHPPPFPSNKNPLLPSSSVPASSSSNSTSSSAGGNVFVPLRRRFLPNPNPGRLTKPRVETQLIGELLLALEEYVSAFGRRVKVSPSRLLLLHQHRHDLSCLSPSEEEPSEEASDEIKTSLAEELEYVTSEVVDVVPAFGEKLILGNYGPLAIRSGTLVDRFRKHEPNESEPAGDEGWWAERLLKDLLEGLVVVDPATLVPEMIRVIEEADEEPAASSSTGSAGGGGLEGDVDQASLPLLASQQRELLDQGRKRWLAFQASSNSFSHF